MARNAGVVVENNFTNGLVTEATGLNFPENAVTETDNCVFEPIGNARRRDGISLEDDHVNIATTDQQKIVTEYLWETVGGNGSLSLVVQQIGGYLYFMTVNETEALSAPPVFIHDLFTHTTDSTKVADNPVSLSDGLGRLIVTHPFCNPGYVSFNRDTGAFTFDQITVQTRDFIGVEPQPVGRSPDITPEHRYNLQNQGWPTDRLVEFRGKAGFYPGDYEVWWLYKRADQYGNEVFLPTDVFNWQTALQYIDRGNSPAPKGSVILTEFYQDRSAATDAPGLPVVTSGTHRPSACAFHAGRVFYSGVQFEEYSSKVYFSQIVEKPNQFGRCYQANDPTSQYSPDLLPSDGGVVSIPDAGNILRLWSINNSLLIIATNGIWEITGSSGIGFTAIDYTVKKISSLTTLSTLSFVSVNGAPFWWGQDGIYAAASQGDVGGIGVTNISDSKIKTFFDTILAEARRDAKGAFNPKEQVIQWVYRSGVATDLAGRFTYDRILNFSLRNQAFYPFSVPAGEMSIKGLLAVKGKGEFILEDEVVDNFGGVVTDNFGDPVTVTLTVQTVNSSAFKYITAKASTNTWAYAEVKEGTRRDWMTQDVPNSGIPFESHFVSGYRIRGNAITKFQSNYIRLFNEGVGNCILYSRWDWSAAASTKRWSSPQLVSFNDLLSKDVQTRRKKLRGSGLALQITIQSQNDDDFNLIGWATFDSSNARP